jgi:hypothetical protein
MAASISFCGNSWRLFVSVLSVCGAGCVCIIIECRANERKKKFSDFSLSLGYLSVERSAFRTFLVTFTVQGTKGGNDVLTTFLFLFYFCLAVRAEGALVFRPLNPHEEMKRRRRSRSVDFTLETHSKGADEETPDGSDRTKSTDAAQVDETQHLKKRRTLETKNPQKNNY